MKKLLLPVLAIALLAIGCTKEETDDRKQFVGNWNGSQTTIIPDLQINETENNIMIIALDNDKARIKITNSSNDVQKATVMGKTYTYDKIIETGILDGLTITIEYTGSGTINANRITEAGQVTVYYSGLVFAGTWNAIYNKM